MLTSKQIKDLFEKLNSRLAQDGEFGEIGIVGGAVMCLVYNARQATKDVDAVFEPANKIRKIAAQIAEEDNLPEDWLNDGAKGFIQAGFNRQEVLELSNLRVWAPEPSYMLAMKCISARWDSKDREDVEFLIDLLRIKKVDRVFEIIEGFYPKQIIAAKTKFFLEELLSS
ncbi:MAG: hypothetical protein J5J00_09155 [Deltaproteobacteria bacterium]|nr:hypothetical protein [Deltaproteobacteria bacterium]